ncbi:DUF2062 domain-containing protein [Terrihabitans soli]|nr:DUF2062 domain-containing protein [Terrihabitans soli]
MSFGRRTQKPLLDRLRDMVWPRMGWGRALRYRGRQLMRISGSPHAIAAGAAAGIFAAFSPLFGFHYIIAATLAFILGGSILASAAVTTLANPLTMPMFWAASYEVGTLFLPGSPHFSATALIEQHSWSALEPFIAPLMLGSVVLGGGLALAVYFPVRRLIAMRHQRKQART